MTRRMNYSSNSIRPASHLHSLLNLRHKPSKSERSLDILSSVLRALAFGILAQVSIAGTCSFNGCMARTTTHSSPSPVPAITSSSSMPFAKVQCSVRASSVSVAKDSLSVVNLSAHACAARITSVSLNTIHARYSSKRIPITLFYSSARLLNNTQRNSMNVRPSCKQHSSRRRRSKTLSRTRKPGRMTKPWMLFNFIRRCSRSVDGPLVCFQSFNEPFRHNQQLKPTQ